MSRTIIELEKNVRRLTALGAARQRAVMLMRDQKAIELLRMSDEELAEQWRNRQAQKIMDLFEEANGKPAATVEELEHWVASPEGRAVLVNHHDQESKIIP